MNRLLPSLLAVLAPASCSTQADEPDDAIERQPVLWEATRGPTTVFLFGTIHVPDERVLELLPEVEDAWSAADTVCFELDLSPRGQRAITAALTAQAQGPPGYSLKEALGPELHGRLAALLSPEFSSRLAALDSMRPWMLAIVLTRSELAKAGLSGEVLDQALHARARDERKRTVALESGDEQAGVFGRLTEDEAIAFLAHSIEEIEQQQGTSDVLQMIHWYLAGDVEKLEAYLAEDFQLPDRELRDKLVKWLLDDRNERMAERLMTEVERDPERTLFVAVGTLHMPGETGLVAQLRERGFEVERVRRAEPAEAR